MTAEFARTVPLVGGQTREQLTMQRASLRDAAKRVLEQEAESGPSITTLALGYLLAEQAYEQARANSWSCRLCGLGLPNAFDRETFVSSLQMSSGFQRAIRIFSETSSVAEGTGWTSAFFALRARHDIGRTDVTNDLAKIALLTPPAGTNNAVVWLARHALDNLRTDIAKTFLQQLGPEASPEVHLWLHALEHRWDRALAAAVEILARKPFSKARDVLALGALAAKHQGIDGADTGARDGGARIALVLAERALMTQDIPGARRWLHWICEHAPMATSAPAALEALAMLADYENDHDATTSNRATGLAQYGSGSAWETAIKARFEAHIAALVLQDPLVLVRDSWPPLLRALKPTAGGLVRPLP